MAEKSSRPYPAWLAAPRSWRTTPDVKSGVRCAAAKPMARSRSFAIRSVMNPGAHPFDAGLSGTTPSAGSRVRTATQSPVAWVTTS